MTMPLPCPQFAIPTPDPGYHITILINRVLPEATRHVNLTAMNAKLECVSSGRTIRPHWVNDTHSALNPTQVARVHEPRSAAQVSDIVRRCADRGLPLAIAGARHSMGGQQFLTGGDLLDTRKLCGVRWFDRANALLEVEAGTTWQDVIRGYLALQRGSEPAFGIRQKQTGADRLTIGGAVASNIHGRGLTAQPFVADLDALEVVTASGDIVRCSRDSRPDLFRHVVGGYGLFGVVTAATLRLVPRIKLERCVRRIEIPGVVDAFDECIANGHLYGDFQFATANDSPEFLNAGILSTYRPADPSRPIPDGQRRLSQCDWNELLTLAHCDKRRAFRRFSEFYLATPGQLYWSDTHQLNLYLEDYHGALDHRLGASVRGSEMITELYVPRRELPAFMDDVRRDFRGHDVDFIYGTIRLIEAERDTALPWARESWACVIFNLHVDHRPADLQRAAGHFRRLIDHALHRGGSYFLTYHRFASAAQMEMAHPGIRGFLAAKSLHDPAGVFRSDWFDHLREALA
jgi:FAD/FMN-containing dehydrogenase